MRAIANRLRFVAFPLTLAAVPNYCPVIVKCEISVEHTQHNTANIYTNSFTCRIRTISN